MFTNKLRAVASVVLCCGLALACGFGAIHFANAQPTPQPKGADPFAGDRPAQDKTPGKLAWRHVGEVRHVFTHFALKLDVYRADAGKRATAGEGEWVEQTEALAGLPTVGRKAVKLALQP